MLCSRTRAHTQLFLQLISCRCTCVSAHQYQVRTTCHCTTGTVCHACMYWRKRFCNAAPGLARRGTQRVLGHAAEILLSASDLCRKSSVRPLSFQPTTDALKRQTMPLGKIVCSSHQRSHATRRPKIVTLTLTLTRESLHRGGEGLRGQRRNSLPPDEGIFSFAPNDLFAWCVRTP